MKKTIAILSATLLAGGIAFAGSHSTSSGGGMFSSGGGEKQGFYAGINAGPAWFQSMTVDRSGVSVDADFNTGGGFIAALGYRFAGGLQLELNTGFVGANVDDAQVRYQGRTLDVGIDGDVSQVPLMATGIYRLFGDQPFSLYAGFGMGTIYSAVEFDSVAGVSSDANDSAWDFGVEFLAGASYSITDNLDANLGYRLLHAFTGNDDDVNAQMVELGATFRF